MSTTQSEAPQSSSWDSIFSHPRPLEIETLKAGTLRSSLSTLINLNSPQAAGMTDQSVTIPSLAHLLQHSVFGSFLIDTGLDSSFMKPGGSYRGLLKAIYFKGRYTAEKGEGIDEQLAVLGEEVRMLFLTHAHEHVAGVFALPKNIIRMCGAGERDFSMFPLLYTDHMKKRPFQALDFGNTQDMPIFGRVLDVFGDGSFWALPTPGHTAGHTCYIANAESGPVLFTGDACVCKKSLELGVEPGKSENPAQCRESFLKIREFVERYPQVKVVFGHECGEYRIQY